ncbi:MAG: hypothetical protein QFX34_03000 [Candidatus Verstraetearchaeota archaeon]|nr:hypothetical protein [Candidatus Verstraetearchaeota archaeon]
MKMKNGANTTRKKEGGFALVITSIAIVLVLLITTLSMRGVFVTINEGDPVPTIVSSQIIKTLLKSASAYASKTGNPLSADAFIKKYLQQLSIFDLELPEPNGTGLVVPETTLRIHRYPSSLSGGFEGKVRIIGLPAGSFAAIASPGKGLVSYAGPALEGVPLEIPLPPGVVKVEGGYLIVYPAGDCLVHRYPATGSATISASYYYSVPATGSPAMVANSWVPPAAFPYVRVTGMAPLSLAVVYDSSGGVAGASMAHGLAYSGSGGEVLVYAPGMPFTGRVEVMRPVAWLAGDIEGGDSYAYTRTGK